MANDDRPELILPPSASMSRRRVLKYGGVGFGIAAAGGFLLGCGDDDDGASTGGDGGDGDDATTDDGGDGGGEARESIKAHFVYIGPPDDNGWTQEHHRGRQAAVDALGDQMESGFTPNVGFDASTTQLFQQLVDDGNDIIFANTEYAQLMTEVADANPDRLFVELNGHYFSDNMYGWYLAHEIPAYLLGVAAGHLTENGRIGYIGAFPTPSTYNDVNGMLLGARSVNPDATVESVLVSTFFDPQKAAQAADALLSSGVEFLFGVMDEPTFLQLAEEAGVWTGYWNLDFRSAAPQWYANNYDLSAFGPFYTDVCQRVLDGTFEVPSEVVLLDCPLGAWGDNVPQEVQDAVAEAAAQIASGDLNVYEGPIVDNAGTEQIPAGEVRDSLWAYNELGFAVEGVTGA